jgi:thymidylate synthase (FAD)
MTVRFIDMMGDDLRIVNMARQSFAVEHTEMTPADYGILNSLAIPPSGIPHGAPWEHVVFSFQVTCSIRVAREWFRHRIGSFSELSTRYAEMKMGVMETPVPRRQVGKAMSYTFEDIEGETGELLVNIFEESLERSLESYHELLTLGASREWAAYVLPLGTITQFSWTVNFRSLTNFFALRTHQTALQEFREDAVLVEKIVWRKLPAAMDAWQRAGRISL